MGSAPTGSVEVVTAAVPFAIVEVPSVVEPEVKVTVPVAPVDTVAVNVTD